MNASSSLTRSPSVTRPRVWLALLGAWTLALAAMASPAMAADWYAASPGGGSACTQVAPCTIQGAIDAASANDTVRVAPGTYPAVNPGIVINKAGLTLVGESSPFNVDPQTLPLNASPTLNNFAGNASDLQSATSGGDNRHVIWVDNVPNVTIRNLLLRHDLRGAREGIIATGNVDGLLIENNYIKFMGGSGSNRFGISISPSPGYAGMHSSVGSQPTSGGQFVTIRNNVLEPTIGSNQFNTYAPKRAISIYTAVGLIQGNHVASSTADLWTLENSVGSQPAGKRSLTIEGNRFYGRLQGQIAGVSGSGASTIIRNNVYTAPGSSVGSITIPGVSPGSLSSAESHLLRLHGPQAEGPTIIEGNTFRGFINQYRALWVQDRRDVEIRGNTFTPETTASDFTAITVGNRQVQSSLNLPGNFGQVAIEGNTFNSGASGNKGKAIYFVNDLGAALDKGDTPYVAFISGGNDFKAGIGWYIALDDRVCSSAQNRHDQATCNGLASHALGQGIDYRIPSTGPNSKKEPFRWDVSASGDTFAGVSMNDMDQAQLDAVRARTYDGIRAGTHADVGDVIYGWTLPPPPPSVVLSIGQNPANTRKTGDVQAFTLAAENTGGPGTVRGRIIVSRVDGGDIVQRATGNGSDAGEDSLQVSTDFGPAELTLSGDGKRVSLIWPPVDVELEGGDTLPSQNVDVLFRVPGNYRVLAEIFDVTDPDTVYGSHQFDYAVTQDLAVTLSGTNPTVYTGNAQALGFSVSPASNPAVASLSALVTLRYAGSATVPANAGTYAMTAVAADADYVPQLAATDYLISPAPAAIQWSQLTLNYTGYPQSVTASIVPINPNLPPIVCAVSPASFGPGVGGYELTAACGAVPANYTVTGGSASATATIGTGATVRRLHDDAEFATVADALADAGTQAGHTLQLSPGVFGPIVLTKAVNLRGSEDLSPMAAGPTPPGPSTIIDGFNAAATGITINTGLEDIQISGVVVRNFTGNCIDALQNNHGLVIKESRVHNCGIHGIHINGLGAGINDVTIQNNEVHTFGSRGIVFWNGAKRDILIDNNHVHNLAGGGCCGIELQDGTATGVRVIDNLVENTGDSGMSFMQLGRLNFQVQHPHINQPEAGKRGSVLRWDTAI